MASQAKVVGVAENQTEVIGFGAMLPQKAKPDIRERCQLTPGTHVQSVLIEAGFGSLEVEPVITRNP